MKYSEHTYEIRDAVLDDCYDLAPRVRKQDVEELEASVDMSVEDQLVFAFKKSTDPKAGVIDGNVECLFGVGVDSLLTVRGTPWLISSDVLVKHAKPFLRGSRDYIRSLEDEYMELSNHVYVKNKDAIRWLRWLGFEIKDPEPFGYKKLMFHPFKLKV